MSIERKKICISMSLSELAQLDNLVDFLTMMNGYRFTRTSAIMHLIKYYRDNLKVEFDEIPNQIKVMPF